MNIQVIPDLKQVIDAAQEANISITDLRFLRRAGGLSVDILESIDLAIEGSEEAVGYFTYLLDKLKLQCLSQS
ncbi:MAG: hypothetical protein K2X66_03440 [Cyanobacteria bacterium]|nr:hypothetical protein [Cyanobacteriota bacterium]